MSTGSNGGLPPLAPVARGVAGKFFEQRAEALPWDNLAQLEDAGGLAGHGLFVLDGAEQSAPAFCLAIALHPSALLPVFAF